MDFGLSDEQVLLDETLRRFLDERLPTGRVREVIDSEAGVDHEAWHALAELGIAGCLVPEAHGGADLTLLDAAVIATVLGRSASPLPFLGSAVLGTLLLREVGSPPLQQAWLPRLAAGDARIAVAAAEHVERRMDAGVTCSDGRLTGTALFVVDGLDADAYWVACGEDLMWVSAAAEGLSIEPLPTIDRTRRAVELRFDGVRPDETCSGTTAALERALDAARVIASADILGCCDRALALSVSYAMDREQFGRPIATFQAVKHLCAEMAAAVEPARSLVWYAAHIWDANPAEAALTSTLCKAHLSEIGQDLVRTATEVHGGIGFTDEYDLQLWFKRVGASRQMLGGPEWLRAHAAGLQGLS